MNSNVASFPKRTLFSIPRSAFRLLRTAGAVAKPARQRLAPKEEVVESSPIQAAPPPSPLPPPRHAPDRVDAFSMAILFSQQFKGW